MPLTTGEVLQLKGLAGTQLLAGSNGLDRQVQWVNIQEVLDCLDVLKAGELLITTGFGLAEDLQLQQSLIQELDQRGLSGLAIQTGFYLTEVPSALISEATRLNFPLLELPREASFRSLTEEILRQIMDKQNQMLTYAESIQTLLTEAALQKQDLGQLTQVLAKHLARRVRILTPDFRLLAESTPVAAEIESINVAAADLAAEYARLKAHKVLPEVSTTTSKAFDGRQIKNLDGVPNQILVPILGAQELFGYLSVLETTNTPSSTSLAAKDLAALTRAAVVCSFILLQEKSLLAAERRLREDFLTDLLAGSFSSEQALTRRADLLEYPLNGPQHVLILAWQDLAKEVPDELIAVLTTYLQQLSCHFLYKSGKQELTLLFGSNQLDGTDVCRLLYQKLAMITFPLYAGSSAHAQTPSQLQLRYREAKESLQLAKTLQCTDEVAFFPDLGVYRLLIGLKHTEELSTFYRQTIENLVKYDQVHQTELIKTLETYFQSRGNSTEAAQKLFIHRHTLTYRLNRINQITGLTPHHPDHALQLQLGLLTAKLYSPAED